MTRSPRNTPGNWLTVTRSSFGKAIGEWGNSPADTAKQLSSNGAFQPFPAVGRDRQTPHGVHLTEQRIWPASRGESAGRERDSSAGTAFATFMVLLSIRRCPTTNMKATNT